MAIGTVLAIASLLSSAYGTAKSAQANNQAEGMLDSRMNDLQSRFDKEYNTNFLDTDQAQSVIKLLGKNFDKQSSKIDGSAAVSGASPEAKVAAKESAQDSYDSSLTRLAGYGTQYKDMKERTFNNRMDGLWGQKLGVQMGKGENFTNLAENSANVAQSGFMADAAGEGKSTIDADGNAIEEGTLWDLFRKNTNSSGASIF